MTEKIIGTSQQYLQLSSALENQTASVFHSGIT